MLFHIQAFLWWIVVLFHQPKDFGRTQATTLLKDQWWMFQMQLFANIVKSKTRKTAGTALACQPASRNFRQMGREGFTWPAAPGKTKMAKLGSERLTVFAMAAQVGNWKSRMGWEIIFHNQQWDTFQLELFWWIPKFSLHHWSEGLTQGWIMQERQYCLLWTNVAVLHKPAVVPKMVPYRALQQRLSVASLCVVSWMFSCKLAPVGTRNYRVDLVIPKYQQANLCCVAQKIFQIWLSWTSLTDMEATTMLLPGKPPWKQLKMASWLYESVAV